MKPRLLEIISRVRHDLDVKRSASIQVTPATTIYLKVSYVLVNYYLCNKLNHSHDPFFDIHIKQFLDSTTISLNGHLQITYTF